MNYLEYRKAAMRHLTTCDLLLRSIANEKTDEKNKILHNVYYLSGYIIETSLNYAFFSLVNHKDDVDKHPLYTKQGMKNHHFDKKIRCIKISNGDLSGLPFISNNSSNGNLDKLYNKWSTDLRYYLGANDIQINERLIESFMSEIKKLSATLLRRF